MWDVLEAAPHDLVAHGEADEVEIGLELEVVRQLRDVKRDALLCPGRMRGNSSVLRCRR